MTRRQLVIVICVSVLLSACNQVATEQHCYRADTVSNPATSIRLQTVQSSDEAWIDGEPPEWLRAVVDRYLKGTKNEMIRLNGADSESWMIDNIQTTDTGRYITIQIGRHVAEADGSEPRFVTDQWIGVDSGTRTIYEYDVARDTAIVWVDK